MQKKTLSFENRNREWLTAAGEEELFACEVLEMDDRAAASSSRWRLNLIKGIRFPADWRINESKTISSFSIIFFSSTKYFNCRLYSMRTYRCFRAQNKQKNKSSKLKLIVQSSNMNNQFNGSQSNLLFIFWY